jgi:hypothetical protein
VSPGGRGRPRERSSNRDRARGRSARRHAADAEGGGLPANGRVGELVVTRQIRDRGDLAQLPHPDPGPLATVLDHQRAFPEAEYGMFLE